MMTLRFSKFPIVLSLKGMEVARSALLEVPDMVEVVEEEFLFMHTADMMIQRSMFTVN